MFVFFGAEDAQITVSIENEVVGAADNASDLAKLLCAHNVTQADELFCSSDVDFASEEGFATDDAAHTIIEEALEII